ncbi:MAG: hypothetical protein GDA48_26970 [Hormoscilla sp. GM102CHS1]|nr:hypothetical protein [Hormoscilla sp. GM102CHS1]
MLLALRLLGNFRQPNLRMSGIEMHPDILISITPTIGIKARLPVNSPEAIARQPIL